MLEVRDLVDMSLQPFQARSQFLPSALAHRETQAFVSWQVPLPSLGRCQYPAVVSLSGCPGCWLETLPYLLHLWMLAYPAVLVASQSSD